MASNRTDGDLKSCLPFTDPVTPGRLEEIVKKQFGETEELKEECLKKLKELINNHGMACVATDDFLLRFLRSKKFEVERSLRAFKNFGRVRAAMHERLLKLGPDVLKTCIRMKLIGILPYRDAEERPLFFFRVGMWNTDICSDEEMLMIFVLFLSYLAQDQSAQIIGFISIYDGADAYLTKLPHLLRHIRFLGDFLYNSLPVKYPQIHVLNKPLHFQIGYQLAKPFISKKIRNRVLLHGKNEETFFQYLDPSILPSEFGGNLTVWNTDYLANEMTNYLHKIKHEQHFLQPAGDQCNA